MSKKKRERGERSVRESKRVGEREREGDQKNTCMSLLTLL